MSVQIVNSEQAPRAIGPYSQAVVANGFAFTAGQIPIDPATGQVVTGDITVQTDRVLQNLTAVLAAVGATWKDVVKTTVYLQDLNDFAAMNAVYERMLGGAKPARSTVQVAALPRGVKVEIDAVAAVKK